MSRRYPRAGFHRRFKPPAKSSGEWVGTFPQPHQGEERLAVYEGKWRCPFCRTVCRGRDMDCVSCGARRGADVEFFLDDDAPPLTDEALLREAADGPDWLCETCGGSNRFGIDKCQTCAAPRGNSRLREVTVNSLPQGGRPPAPHRPNSYQAPRQAAAGASGVPRRPPNFTLAILVVSIFGAGLVLLYLLLLLSGAIRPTQKALAPKAEPRALVTKPDPTPAVSRQVELAVERVEWRRSIVVEEYREVVSEDWEGSVPSDARVISRRQEVHHHECVKAGSHVVRENYTERVKVGTRTVTETYTDREYGGTESYKCGTRNRGNGYFEDVYCTRPVYRTVTKTRNKQVDDYQTVTRTREKPVDDYKDVPVYRLKVEYSVKRWVQAETLVERGADLKPRWPKFVGSKTKKERVRGESYRVFLRDLQTDKVYEREVSSQEFSLFTDGAKCQATVNGSDQIVAFTPPTR